MTRLINSFVGTNGATVSTANSNLGGAAFDVVEIGTGATLVYDTGTPGGGDTSGRCTTTGTAATCRVGWRTSLGSPGVLYGVLYLYMTALPAADQRIVQFLSSTNGTRFSLYIKPSGQVQIASATGAQASGNRTTATINLGLTRIEWRVEMSPSGIPTIKLFTTNPSTSTIPDETKVGVATDFQDVAAGYYFGIPSPIANVGPVYLSAVGLSDTDWLGPSLTADNTNPTVSLYQPTSRWAWGDLVTIMASVTDPDVGATHTTAWTVLSKPADSAMSIGATTDLITFTPDRPGDYTLRVNIADNVGATTSADISFTVYPVFYVKAGGVEVPARLYPVVTTAQVGSALVGTSTITP